MHADKGNPSQSLGSSRVTVITRRPAAEVLIRRYSQARGLVIVVTQLEPSDCGRAI